jgi:hypothetical protein
MMPRTKKQLEEEIAQLKANIDCAMMEIIGFVAHLQSKKFQGTERCCNVCGAVQPGIQLQCTCLDSSGRFCSGVMQEQRKDWIAIADVRQRLNHIAEWLDYNTTPNTKG